MSHTPGPWKVDPDGYCPEEGGINIFNGATHGDIDQYQVAWVQAWQRTQNQNLAIAEANARLIAAAPDLLEALEVFFAYHNPRDCACGHASEDVHDEDCPIYIARAAIKKARGEK